MATAAVVKSLGQPISYTPGTNLSQGDVVVLGSVLAVAMKDTPSGVKGLFQPTGIVSFPKATSGGSGAALAMGTQAYWDATNKIVSNSPSVGPFAGIVVTQGAADADTNVYVLMMPADSLPGAKYGTTALLNTTLTAGLITGGAETYLLSTANGANALTTRTATQMFADTPGASVGQSYGLRILNSGNNTVTLTAGSGVTLTGTMTIATNTWRDFVVTFNTATTMTFQSVGTGPI